MRKSILLLLFLGFLGNSFAQMVEKKKHTIELTKDEFIKKVMNYEANPTKWIFLSDKPCIVDFYTTWCGPCKMLAPTLEELAKEHKESIYIYKVDAEKEAPLAYAFGVRSYPSLLFCPMNGNPQFVRGALPREDLKSLINQLLLPVRK